MASAASGARADAFRLATDCYHRLEAGAPRIAAEVCTAAMDAGALSQTNLAVTANNRGRAFLRLGDYPAAERDFTRAIAADPEYAHPFNNRALARQRMGDLKGARADLDAALRLEPTYAHALFHRAELRRDLGDLAGARADLEAALRQQPDLEPALALRAVLAEPAAPAAPIETAWEPIAFSSAAAFTSVMTFEAEAEDETQAADAPPPAPTALPDPEALAKASGIETADFAVGAGRIDLAIPEAPKAPRAAPHAPLPKRLNPAPTMEEFETAFRIGALDVRRAQKMLREFGYRPGPADGVYGSQTRRALELCLEEGCPFSLR